MNRIAFKMLAGVGLLGIVGLFMVSVAPARAAARSTPSAAPAEHQTMPAALRPALYKALSKDASQTAHFDENGCLASAERSLKACFDEHGAHFSGGPALSLHLAAYGRVAGDDVDRSKLTPVKPVAPQINGSEVSYRHGTLTAWWRVLPVGFEQGFTIAERPNGQGQLVLALAANRRGVGTPTTRHSREGGNSVGTLTWGKLHYGKLIVTDSNGKTVPAALETKGSHILIAVNDDDAVYPLIVDPRVWLQQQRLLDSGGVKLDVLGISGDLSRSGNTAAFGTGWYTQNLRVAVFEKKDGQWIQTTTLTKPADDSGDEFGNAIAVSDSGNTILVGDFTSSINGNNSQGKAYVFSKNAQGAWTQTGEFTEKNGAANDWFGLVVAMSNDSTALISAPHRKVNVGTPEEYEGVAYIFRKETGGWTQVATLTGDQKQRSISYNNGSDLYGAWGMDISGNLAVVTAIGAASGNVAQGQGHWGVGAAYVFGRTQTGWAQITKLLPVDGVRYQSFGTSVAISDSTILVGDRAKNHDIGAAYVFEKTSDGWTQKAKLTASDGTTRNAWFGKSVALSGTTALIGAQAALVDGLPYGAAYVFQKTDSGWTQTAKLVPSRKSGALFGNIVGLASTTAMVTYPGATVDGIPGRGEAMVYGLGNLDLDLSVPQNVLPGTSYVGQTIVTNNASAASPAVAVTVAVPAAATFVSANATQGSCSEVSRVVTCNFGQIHGNAGTARANVKLKATGRVGDKIEYKAGIARATPALSASAATQIINDQPPVAKDGTLTANKNTAGSGTLEASDPDGDALTFSIVDQPQHGSVKRDDASTGAYTYTPDQDYSGADSFTFKANDGYLDSNVATVSVTVNDQPPVAKDGTLTIDENATGSGTLETSDPDGDTLTFSIVDQPQHGKVKLDDASTGTYTYTPNQGYIGSDSFTFKANDGEQNSNVATVSITVKAPPPPHKDSGGGASGLLGLLGLALVGLVSLLRRKRY